MWTYGLQAQNGPDGKPYGYHYDGFAQTEWKVRPNLSLTAGLRYEVNPPFQDATNQLGNFNYKVPGGQLVLNPNENINPLWKEAVGNTPFVLGSSVGLGPGMRYTYWDNIQPRLGFTWSPSSSHDTVVRASAGMYSVPVLGAVLYSLLGIDTSYYGTYAPTTYHSHIELQQRLLRDAGRFFLPGLSPRQPMESEGSASLPVECGV